MKIAVCTIMPPQALSFFREIPALYYAHLKDLGYEVTQVENRLVKGALNLLIGYQFMPLKHLEYVINNYDYVLLQLEQLSTSAGYFMQKQDMFKQLIPLMKGAQQIWDYTPENIDFLKQLGIEARLMPLGYHESLKRFQPADTQEIDVLFFGNLYPKRRAILEELEQHCHLHTLYWIFDQERDEVLQRAKVVINIHSYEGLDIMEQARLFYLLSNHCFVVSESCSWNPYGDGLVTYPYDQLVEGVLEWLKKSPGQRRDMAHRGHLALQNIPFKENLERFLTPLMN